MIVNSPLTDFISYPSPALSALSETSSILEFPSVALEFFNMNAPSVTSVVKRKSPSVALDMVSPFSKAIFPATVTAPEASVKRSVSEV